MTVVQKASLCRMVLVTVDPHGNNGADEAPAVARLLAARRR